MKVTTSHSMSSNAHPSKRLHVVRPVLLAIMLASLTGCGGGGGSTTPVIPSDDGPEVIYIDDNPFVPVQYAAFGVSAISGTLKQQTVTNADDVWALGYKGQGITIGVVDSGVNQNHVDFYDDNGNSRVNWNDARSIEYILADDSIVYTNDYRDIDAPDFHGTHVSSIALGREYGIAPEATLLPVNVFLILALPITLLFMKLLIILLQKYLSLMHLLPEWLTYQPMVVRLANSTPILQPCKPTILL